MNSIPIFLASDNNYAPFMCVTMYSIFLNIKSLGTKDFYKVADKTAFKKIIRTRLKNEPPEKFIHLIFSAKNSPDRRHKVIIIFGIKIKIRRKDNPKTLNDNGKKSLLYIRHSYHSKTKSNDFLLDILKEQYDITVYDIDPYAQDEREMIKNAPIKDVDMLILFQLPINGNLIKKHIKFKKAAFFPMYDGVPHRNDILWLSYKDFNIVNFSKTLHEELKEIGFSSHYIQYFPKPVKTESMGNLKSAFFWQRISDINVNSLKDILKSLDVNFVHLHKAVDPEHKFVEPDGQDFEIEYSTWYENKSDMLKDIENSSIYIAPRKKEGIGMSFLEAMAMGRCVVAVNSATMNEYIEDGKTGILYDFENPKLNKEYDVRKIQQNSLQYIKDGYLEWKKSKNKIIEYINSETNVKTKKIILHFLIPFIKNSIIKNIFSIENTKNRQFKVIKIVGFEIKFRR